MFCVLGRTHHIKRYLIDGKAKFDVKCELESLSIAYGQRKFICKYRRQALIKRRSVIDQQAKVESEIRALCGKPDNEALQGTRKRTACSDANELTPKKSRIEVDNVLATSTPNQVRRSITTPDFNNYSSIQRAKDSQNMSNPTQLSVNTNSCNNSRNIPKQIQIRFLQNLDILSCTRLSSAAVYSKLPYQRLPVSCRQVSEHIFCTKKTSYCLLLLRQKTLDFKVPFDFRKRFFP